MIFRRYDSLALATAPLTEGVTPPGKKLTYTDITMTLQQYGDRIPFTDVVEVNHPDSTINEATVILGEQAAKTIETMRYGILKACTNVFYTNGTARTDVNTQFNLTDHRRVIRALLRQNAEPVTMAVKSTPNFNTESVLPSFIVLCHTDCMTDVRTAQGFIDVKDYGSTSPYENEFGGVESARFLTSNLYTPWADGGGTYNTTITSISTTGATSDVYPYLYIGRLSYAISALKGKYAIVPIVLYATPSKGDELGQRGSVGWKTQQGCVITNDLWMGCLQAAVTELS
jgi:N4-gp56 family major capsid protein